MDILLQSFSDLPGLEGRKYKLPSPAETVASVEVVEDELIVTYADGSTDTYQISTSSGSGLAFNGGRCVKIDPEGNPSDDYYLWLTMDGEELDPEIFTPFVIPAGSGGGGGDSGSRLTFAVYTASKFSVLQSASTAPIVYKFTSVDVETGTATGAGNLAIYVGGTLRTNMTIAQGDNLSVDVFNYLTTGANSVKLVITDSYGVSKSRQFTITLESFNIEWSLSEVNKNSDVLNFYMTPNGSGTKTIYTYVDGALHSTDTVTTTGRRLTKAISGLTHGMHTIEVYGIMTVEGSTLESNHLKAAVAQIGSSNAPVIAVNWPTGDLTQFTTEQIPFLVVNPVANPASVSLLVNNVIQQTLTVDQSQQTWSYRPVTPGTYTLGIMCGSVMVSKTVTVTGIGTEVDEVTDGLAIKLDPSVITDLSTWSYGAYGITLSQDFDLTNGGIQIDDDGVYCIRITAGDRLTLNYPLFGGDARRDGRECKIIYRVANSSAKDAVAISCMQSGIGLNVKANNVYLSGNQTTIMLPVCEDQKVELDMNIQQDSEDLLMSLWEKCSTFKINKYAGNEDFSHVSNVGVTFGSDDADVYLYLFRAYSRDLTNTELKANFVYDGASGTEILARDQRNDIYDSGGAINVEAAAAANPNAHFITINAARMTLGKKDAVPGTISHVYVAGGAAHKFTADVIMKVQGTSSVEHAATAGPNINFEMNNILLEDGTELTDGYAMHGVTNSIPTKLLTFKKNIASEDHVVNRAIAEWYNTYQPSVRPARVADPRVRDCLESVMCVVLFHNTGNSPVVVGPDTVGPDETVFFGLGNLCSNKDAEEVFEYDDIVIEVKNNTEDVVRFKTDDLTDFDTNYEFRYLNEEAYTEAQAKAAWQVVQTFIYETDWTAATNTALSPVQTINGQTFAVDSAAYRKARWAAEAPSLFDMDTLYFHHNITLFYLLRDNRAKNMFWSRNSAGKWGLWFNWDNDTGLCRNNEGYIDIEPGYMDFDTIGTADVFNGADNALFTNLREVNANALKENYLAMESAGAWDIDAFYAYVVESQESICEALWIEDAEHNAIRTMQNLGTEAYLERATGRLTLHLLKALTFQKVLVDSYYNSTAATSDSASFRGYTPSTWAGVQPSGILSITPYTDMYINILAGSTSYRQRAYAGVPITMDLSAALNDTEIYLRHAPWIQELGDMSGLYLGEFEAHRLIRVKTLKIGSSVTGYYNTNFTTASFDNCVKLEEVNLGGLTNAARSFDFSTNIYLKRIYTKGSGITGIVFAKNGRLVEARLNAVASLYMSGLRMLETFEMEAYSSLTSLSVEDSPAVDSYAIASAAANLTKVRLLEIDWSVPTAAYDLLVRLHNIHGIDDEGHDVTNGVITGDVFFRAITQTKYNSISALFGDDVTFTYGELLTEVNVTFKNSDGSVLYTTKTELGGSVPDPIAAGLIPTPTKAADIDYVYTFYAWDASLDYIPFDTIITATYTEATRTYTVRYIDYDGTVLESYTVSARGSASYQGGDLRRSGYIWTGWSANANEVIEDMDIRAVYVYPTMPSTNHYDDMASFDFAYSDDPNDNSAYTFGELYSIIKTGRTASYLPISSKIKLVWNTTLITDSYSIFSLHSIGHYELVESGAMSNADFYMTHLLIGKRAMNSSGTNSGGWDSCAMRTWLNNRLYAAMPVQWRQLIAKSVTRASAGGQTSTILESEDYLRIPSQAEVGFNTGSIPYSDEIDSRAAQKAFSVYTSNNSRIKKDYYGTGTAQAWWLRSPASDSSSPFRDVNNGGTAYANSATNSNGVCAGFSA